MPPKKKPFSGKQKKLQLQHKKHRKKDKVPFGTSPPKLSPKLLPDSSSESVSDENEEEREKSSTEVGGAVVVQSKPPARPHRQAVQTVIKGYDPNRFRLHFHQEPQCEIERRKYESKTVPVVRIAEEELEVGMDDVYQPGSVLDIPKRPVWDYSMSKDQVERREEAMFSKYVQDIFAKYPPKNLSYFELNLETWRQLWRVLEISDLILLITDIRHPALHFSPALYNFVVKDLKKEIVLVLNKVDLVPPQVVFAWKEYFLSRFPDLPICCFSSFPSEQASVESIGKVKFKLRKKGAFKSAIGPQDLCRIVESIFKHSKVNTLSWKQRLESHSDVVGLESDEAVNKGIEKDDTILTIGLVGHPNVGKSSILNGLMEKKTVSTSRTPGHTKHFQTIFLTPSIRLCDCPGLVFPSLVSKQLQILSGMYPVAQVKEPYSVVGYLAQRLPLVQMLSLNHPNPSCHGQTGEVVWTPWDICDAWAERRGYYTRRGARPDTYRAANDLLRLAVDGRICLYFRPPGYHKNKMQLDAHPDVQELIRLRSLGITMSDEGSDNDEEDSSDTSDTDSEESFTVTSETKFSALMTLKDVTDV